jgi:hypothetical protein
MDLAQPLSVGAASLHALRHLVSFGGPKGQARATLMHSMTRAEIRRAMLAQLSDSQRGGQVNAEAIVSAFVEQLIALRDHFEQDVARLQATLEAELAAAKRELNDLRAALNDRDRAST